MQLDFFKKIFGPLSPPPTKPPQPAKIPTPVRISGKNTPTIAPWFNRAREILRAAGAEELAKRLQVRWNSRMRSTAGTAYPGKSLVNLNPRLLEFGEAEVDRTLRHELAHLLAHYRAGRRRIAPHGVQWQQACRDLGLQNESRCHTLPLPRRKMHRPHRYRCPHCAVELHRARPLRRKTACLACCRKWSGGRYDELFRFAKAI